MITYRVFDRKTDELLGEFTPREFLDNVRGATPERAAEVRVVVVGNTGKTKEVEPLAEVARLIVREEMRREKFEATHRRVTVAQGVTSFARPRIFYVKK